MRVKLLRLSLSSVGLCSNLLAMGPAQCQYSNQVSATRKSCFFSFSRLFECKLHGTDTSEAHASDTAPRRGGNPAKSHRSTVSSLSSVGLCSNLLAMGPAQCQYSDQVSATLPPDVARLCAAELLGRHGEESKACFDRCVSKCSVRFQMISASPNVRRVSR